MQLCTEVHDFSHWTVLINIHELRRRLPPRSGMNIYEGNVPATRDTSSHTLWYGLKFSASDAWNMVGVCVCVCV